MRDVVQEKHGIEEGDVCGRDGCLGVLEIEQPDNCSCHINPPCEACTNVKLVCPECGWKDEG